MRPPLSVADRWRPASDLLDEGRIDEATALLLGAAQAGDADAQLLLAERWYLGEYEHVPWDETLRWLEAAAAQGHPDAMWRLAAWRRDAPLDRDRLLAAAEAGSAGAQCAVAGYFTDGEEGFPTDPVRGAAWYRRAAENGDVFSMWACGCHAELGLGVSRDFAAAVAWYERCAFAEPQDGSGVQAAYALERAYREGELGVTPDPERADFWCRRACELREDRRLARQELNLALRRIHGPRDLPSVVAAAAQGDPQAVRVMVMLHDDGLEGFARDPAAAIGWLRRLAESGDVDAMGDLGSRLLRDDPSEGIAWLGRVADADPPHELSSWAASLREAYLRSRKP